MSNNFANESFERLKNYSDDLSGRLRLLDEWLLRHPDSESQQFRHDARDWELGSGTKEEHNFQSTFDPNDERPDTYDTISAQRFNDLILVALKAYEKAIINE